MNIKNFWMIVVVGLVSLCTISCGSDDEDKGGTNENPITAKDPEGTIIANLTSGAKYRDGILLRPNSEKMTYLYMDGSNNLTICDYNGNVGLSCGIVCVGQVNGLSSITSNSYKEYAGKSAAIPGYGYIFYDRGNQYYRLFVEN